MAYVAFTFKIIEKAGTADTDMCSINRHVHPLSGSQPIYLALHNIEAELRADTASPPLSLIYQYVLDRSDLSVFGFYYWS